MGGAGVEYLYRRVGQPSCSLPSGVIREAKQRDLRIPKRLLARRRILTQFFGKNQDLKIIAAGKPIANP
jgi:hypothetical protein